MFIFILLTAIFTTFVSADYVDFYCYSNVTNLNSYQESWGPAREYFRVNECKQLSGGLFLERKYAGGPIKIYTNSDCTVEHSTINLEECVQHESYMWKWKFSRFDQFDTVNNDCYDRNFLYYGFSSPVRCRNHTKVMHTHKIEEEIRNIKVVKIDYKAHLDHQEVEDLNVTCQQELTKSYNQFEELSSDLDNFKSTIKTSFKDYKEELIKSISSLASNNTNNVKNFS